MDDLFHKEADSNLEPKTRRCLMCSEVFESDWAGERVCKRCKGTAAWRSGTAAKTPKVASARDHNTSCAALNVRAPSGGFSAGVSIAMAGMTPTKPAASGIVAVATAVVCAALCGCSGT